MSLLRRALAGWRHPLRALAMALAASARHGDECFARRLREMRESEDEWRDGTDE